MVMLNDITEQAIIDNLKKRYKESLIYVLQFLRNLYLQFTRLPLDLYSSH